MSLLFGNLTQSFVNFGAIINQANDGVPGASQNVTVAAASFRRAASHDAGILAALGELALASWATLAKVSC